MSSYDDYQKSASRIGKEPGKLSSDDIAFMASQSKDPGRAYAEYEMFNNSERSSGNGGSSGEGCYIATCVYGSYDCPEVWVLRRFRDRILRRTVPGRYLVNIYYALSPRMVACWGGSPLFRVFWKMSLDGLVKQLRKKGIENTPYTDNN